MKIYMTAPQPVANIPLGHNGRPAQAADLEYARSMVRWYGSAFREDVLKLVANINDNTTTGRIGVTEFKGLVEDAVHSIERQLLHMQERMS